MSIFFIFFSSKKKLFILFDLLKSKYLNIFFFLEINFLFVVVIITVAPNLINLSDIHLPIPLFPPVIKTPRYIKNKKEMIPYYIKIHNTLRKEFETEKSQGMVMVNYIANRQKHKNL